MSAGVVELLEPIQVNVANGQTGVRAIGYCQCLLGSVGLAAQESGVELVVQHCLLVTLNSLQLTLGFMQGRDVVEHRTVHQKFAISTHHSGRREADLVKFITGADYFNLNIVDPAPCANRLVALQKRALLMPTKSSLVPPSHSSRVPGYAGRPIQQLSLLTAAPAVRVEVGIGTDQQPGYSIVLGRLNAEHELINGFHAGNHQADRVLARLQWRPVFRDKPPIEVHRGFAHHLVD